MMHAEYSTEHIYTAQNENHLRMVNTKQDNSFQFQFGRETGIWREREKNVVKRENNKQMST